MLAVFDVDGTLCDTQHVEGRCYALAIERVTGMSLDTLDWSAYDEPTSSAIVRHLLDSDPKAIEKEEKIKSEFCRLLQEERPSYPGDFVPVPGAVEFLERLSAEKVCEVAIATGCFDVTARFKLECCGIGLDQYPHATSSDTSRRRDIISLATQRAGFNLSSVVYFGDAPWDIRVSRALNIPMIGIGRRDEQLRTLGLRYVFRDYSEHDKIIDALRALRLVNHLNQE
jgi:phosphoglycolate phosphatase-like HAD superfamily hydrolase